MIAAKKKTVNRKQKTRSQPASEGEKLQTTVEEQKPIKFQTQAPAKSQVYVAGTFNNWNPSADRLRYGRDQVYALNLSLPSGRHEYKFVVDGEWRLDSDNPTWAPNGQGSLNSIIEI